VHCTGEPAFAILKQTFGDRYVYAGLGTTLALGRAVTSVAEAGQPQMQAMDEDDLQSYRDLLARGADAELPLLAHAPPESEDPLVER
jgi:7,8-dihydropterin-6-yl-methyl-4-(beta-D-ribofuranosyl)aminobenzene 5'-phosphate synthase